MIENATNAIEDLTLLIEQEIHVHASLEDTFEALLEQLGPANEAGEGRAMPMVLEAWPGGRWYRDLGKDTGHMWGHVQAIKAPELLEIYGPLFMSFPATSNLQFRLKTEGSATILRFVHTAMGLIPEDVSADVSTGWDNMLKHIRAASEGRGAGQR
jgi:hypothetical protein